MPDNFENTANRVYWLSGTEPESEPLSSPDTTLHRMRLLTPADARATATAIARGPGGLAVVESSCPAFVAVCQILGSSPNIRFVTLHPRWKCLDSLELPPPTLRATP